MTPGCFDWPTQYAGDTARYHEFVVKEGGEAVDLTGATITMQARRGRGQAALVDLTSVASAGIEITDATAGTFTIGGYSIPDIASAVLTYDVQVTFADGSKRTYIAGSYPVQGQVTT